MINFDGLLIGIVTFLIIGLFHPVVVKAEYYWGDEVLVDIPCLGDFRGDSFPVYRQRVCVRYLRRIRLLIVLDDQGDFRAGGACAERLVP